MFESGAFGYVNVLSSAADAHGPGMRYLITI